MRYMRYVDPEFFESQSLRQEGQWDCGVEVFGKLAGVSREELLRELPGAMNGIPMRQWEEWLKTKGLILEPHPDGEAYTLPCAHLIRRPPNHHWIYEDSTGIHDPDPKFAFVPPKQIKLASPWYPDGRQHTISVRIRSDLATS